MTISLSSTASKKKIPYTGKKRGPKTKEEKAAIAAAAAAAGEDVTIAALAAKKPYTGKKRGPKTKAEKAARSGGGEERRGAPLLHDQVPPRAGTKAQGRDGGRDDPAAQEEGGSIGPEEVRQEGHGFPRGRVGAIGDN